MDFKSRPTNIQTMILLFKNRNFVASYNVENAIRLKRTKVFSLSKYNWNRNANVAIGKIPNPNGLHCKYL